MGNGRRTSVDFRVVERSVLAKWILRIEGVGCTRFSILEVSCICMFWNCHDVFACFAGHLFTRNCMQVSDTQNVGIVRRSNIDSCAQTRCTEAR